MERKSDGFDNQKVIVIPNDILKILASDKLTRLLYITDIGFYPHAAGHYRSRKDGSNQNILIYCKDGEGWYMVNGKRCTVGRNQFFVISAETPHIYAASDTNPWSIFWMHFTGEMADLLNDMYNQTHTIPETSDSRFDARNQMFEEIFINLWRDYNIENLRYSSMVLWHFIGSLAYIPQFRLITHDDSTDVIEKAISFMKSSINKILSLEEIASHVNYSPSHFGLIFSKRTGFTPINYFHNLKIQAACRYLDFSDLKIKEIAQMLGYYDQYHFSKTFTKVMKISPSEYKSRDKG